MELVGDQPGEISSSVHGPGYVRAGLTAPYRLPEGAAFADGFHTFAIDRSPSEMFTSAAPTTNSQKLSALRNG